MNVRNILLCTDQSCFRYTEICSPADSRSFAASHFRIHFINSSTWNLSQHDAEVLNFIETVLGAPMSVLVISATCLCVCLFKLSVSAPSKRMLFYYRHISMFVLQERNHGGRCSPKKNFRPPWKNAFDMV